jgi:5S rRNA maturation endonuclease (ribonuclease M5)
MVIPPPDTPNGLHLWLAIHYPHQLRLFNQISPCFSVLVLFDPEGEGSLILQNIVIYLSNTCHIPENVNLHVNELEE